MTGNPAPHDIATEADTERSEQFVRFYVGDETYALPMVGIQEVLRVCDIAPVPGAPAQVLGVINLRGRVVPVVALRRLLELPPHPETAESMRLVVVEVERESVALVVDAVAGLANVPSGMIEPAPPVGSRALPISGVMAVAEEILLLLDADAVVAECRGRAANA